jgi:predicted nucleic acid-binding protein
VVVVDSSFVVAALIVEGHTTFAAEVLEQLADEPLAAPQLVMWEIANVLQKRIVRGVIDARDRQDVWTMLELYGLDLHQAPPSGEMDRLGQLADRHGLSAYDAAFLDLALVEGAALATLDRDLARAGVAEGLTVLSPYAP